MRRNYVNKRRRTSLACDHSDKDDAKYEAVTLDDVKRVAAKVLAGDKYVISVVKPGK